MTLTLTIGRKTHQVANVADGSKLYSKLRDASGKGMRSWPEGVVTNEAGAFIARVSYNGNVWQEPTWAPGQLTMFRAEWAA